LPGRVTDYGCGMFERTQCGIARRGAKVRHTTFEEMPNAASELGCEVQIAERLLPIRLLPAL